MANNVFMGHICRLHGRSTCSHRLWVIHGNSLDSCMSGRRYLCPQARPQPCNEKASVYINNISQYPH